MIIDDEFGVDLPLDRVWPVLLDVPSVAPCLPGAELTGEQDGAYSGTIRVRIGPVLAEYAGTATLAEVDEPARRVVIDARGRDRRGGAIASAKIEAALRGEGGRTVVSVHTDLRITGKLAQFGSAALQPVSAAMLEQFARNLQERLMAEGAQEDADSAESADAAPPADLARLVAAPLRRLAVPAGVAVLVLVALAVAFRRRR